MPLDLLVHAVDGERERHSTHLYHTTTQTVLAQAKNESLYGPGQGKRRSLTLVADTSRDADQLEVLVVLFDV